MKIILVLDALTFDENQINFAAYIAELTNGEVTTVFLENMLHVYEPFSKYGHLTGYQLPEEEIEETNKEIINKNIEAYKQLCTEKHLSGNLVRIKGNPEEEIIKASRFADLLLISNNFSFTAQHKESATKFVEDILMQVQCAVLVIPATMQKINEVVFTCNGNFSSINSLRQFTYLFPSLKHKKISILYVSENDDELIPHKKNITEYINHHYKNWQLKILSGHPSAAIQSHLSKQKDCLVTFGAYGRSKFSQFFLKSNAENIVRTLNIPVFITHT